MDISTSNADKNVKAEKNHGKKDMSYVREIISMLIGLILFTVTVALLLMYLEERLMGM